MGKQVVKPSILPGFMELLPADQILFNRVLDTIRKNYEQYGFVPLDTPVIEKSEILLAKGGGETEKQIYRFTKGDSDLSLRFDLTVPLARYVAQHFSSLTFPFRRYHIGKVYRGERNQKGRFREFYQCDIDIIGNNELSVLNDAEIPSIIYSTFRALNFGKFTIYINNRKILNGFFDSLGIEDKAAVLRTIDKLDKIGLEAVETELGSMGLAAPTIQKVLDFIRFAGSNDDTLAMLQSLGIENPLFAEGLHELSQVVSSIRCFAVPEEYFAINLKIARGLDYYTGTVYETLLDEYPQIGSVCSGGRYDNLAEYYTTQKLPGVGISIGLTRLFYQLREANLLQAEAGALSQVLVVPMNTPVEHSIAVANTLRTAGIVTEIYFNDAKTSKKLDYANKLGIRYVVFVGQDEVDQNLYTIKDMSTGEQQKQPLDKIASLFGGR